MKIRKLNINDLNSLHKIHHEFYPNDALPNFARNFYSAFVVVDDNDCIITCGGVEAIAEAVVLTDKDFSVHTRTSAMMEILRALILTCNRVNQDYLHAFIINDQDESWIRTLNKVGFNPIPGRSFFLEV